MKISTNSFGNYNPVKPHSNLAIKKDLELNSEVKITKEEKKFFTKMYPEQKESIEKYHFYDKKGDVSGFSLGSLFDKRG